MISITIGKDVISFLALQKEVYFAMLQRAPPSFLYVGIRYLGKITEEGRKK